MMNPDRQIDWAMAREMFRRAFRSSFHYAIATVGEDGAPHLTPIGSVLLDDPGRGIFFDIFSSRLSQNLDRDPRVCVMAVDSGKSFWLASLTRGHFTAPPALRLTGTAGPRRPATPPNSNAGSAGCDRFAGSKATSSYRATSPTCGISPSSPHSPSDSAR